jgi:ferredoxin
MVIFSATLFADKNGYESLTGTLLVFEDICHFHMEADTIKLYVVTSELLEESDFPLVSDEQYTIKGFSTSKGFLVYGLTTADGERHFANEGDRLLMVSGSPEVSYRVDPRSCISCRLCVRYCPVGAITMSRGVAVIDQDKCISCGICSEGDFQRFEGCPVEAIREEKKE